MIVPPIKIQGKKTKLVRKIMEIADEILNEHPEIDTWVEPFLGSGVVAFNCPDRIKKVVVNEGIYKNPLVLWFVSVARSGSNKSYPMKLVTQPLRRIDEELYAEYKREYDDWKTIPAKDRADEPKCPAIVLDDCTDERRSEILFMNNDTNESQIQQVAKRGNKRGAIGIYPELKGMFDSKNQYQNGGTSAISKLLRLFD